MDNIDIKNLQKMIFVFNAVQSGWTVRKIDEIRFEFKKNKNNKTELELDFLTEFINNNMDIERFLNNKV